MQKRNTDSIKEAIFVKFHTEPRFLRSNGVYKKEKELLNYATNIIDMLRDKCSMSHKKTCEEI